MVRSRFSPPRLACAAGAAVLPFVDAEEAWFWFMRCQRARNEGARFKNAAGGPVRPCDPDDLYRAVMALLRRRLIGRDHLKVLAHFGFREAPPDPRLAEQSGAYRLWCEALDRLTTVLKSKGIIHAA